MKRVKKKPSGKIESKIRELTRRLRKFFKEFDIPYRSGVLTFFIDTSAAKSAKINEKLDTIEEMIADLQYLEEKYENEYRTRVKDKDLNWFDRRMQQLEPVVDREERDPIAVVQYTVLLELHYQKVQEKKGMMVKQFERAREYLDDEDIQREHCTIMDLLSKIQGELTNALEAYKREEELQQKEEAEDEARVDKWKKELMTRYKKEDILIRNISYIRGDIQSAVILCKDDKTRTEGRQARRLSAKQWGEMTRLIVNENLKIASIRALPDYGRREFEDGW